MTSKEKAKKLYDKYCKVLPDSGDISQSDVQQCVLISVDEILNNDGFTQFDQYLTEYWQQVKAEINNL